MINSVTISDYVTEDDQKILASYCHSGEVDDFLGEVAIIINKLALHVMLEKKPIVVPKRMAKYWIELTRGRRKFKGKPSLKVNMESIIKKLEQLEIEGLLHIAENTSGGLDAYHSILNALKKPYVPREGDGIAR